MPYRNRVGQVVSAASARREPLYATFRQSSDPMMLIDPEDRRVVDANEAYLRLVGYARDEVIGRPYYEHAVGGTRLSLGQWHELARTLMRNTDFVFTILREMMNRDGSTALVQWSFTTETVTGRGLILEVGVPVQDEYPASPLTKREREIVGLLALGKRGPEIAGQLFISEETVTTHVRNARLKLGAATRAELIARALGSGLIS